MAFLVPIFAIHELEELLGFRRFLDRRRGELVARFPRLARRMVRLGLFEWRTATFGVGVAHEGVLLLVVVTASLCIGAYHWWYAALAGYTFHLLVHIGQWLVMRCYVPCIITSLLTLPYCVGLLWRFATSELATLVGMVVWAAVGIVLTGVSLLSAYVVMRLHHRYVG